MDISLQTSCHWKGIILKEGDACFNKKVLEKIVFKSKNLRARYWAIDKLTDKSTLSSLFEDENFLIRRRAIRRIKELDQGWV